MGRAAHSPAILPNLGGGSDAEDLRPANLTHALARRTAILQRYLLDVLHLPLRPALDAVGFHWFCSPRRVLCWCLTGVGCDPFGILIHAYAGTNHSSVTTGALPRFLDRFYTGQPNARGDSRAS